MYTWFVSITSTSFFMVWALGCITSWRFRAALKAQADPLFQEIYAFECLWWPLPPIWLFACCILFTVGCFYIGLYPIGQDVPSVYSFFSYMIGLILVAVSGLGYKLVYGTKVVDPRFADLKTGRRPIVGKELEDLRAYYAMPKWRRFGTYIQLW
jgi:amino acid transporter